MTIAQYLQGRPGYAGSGANAFVDDLTFVPIVGGGDTELIQAVIDFPALPAKQVDDADFNVTPTSNSSAAIVLASSDPAIATVTHVSGNTWTIGVIAEGNCNITASQVATGNYTEADDVIRSFTVDEDLGGDSFLEYASKNTTITESPAHTFTDDGSANWGTILFAKYLPANTDGYVIWSYSETASVADLALVSLDTVNTLSPHVNSGTTTTNAIAGMRPLAFGRKIAYSADSSFINAGDRTDETHFKLQRTAGNLQFFTSSDNKATWDLIYTWTVNNSALYVKATVEGLNKIVGIIGSSTLV